jgi:hypothetical protein
MTSIVDMAMSSRSIDMAPRAGAEPAIDWLRLAAAPVFAAMALLTAMGDGPMPMICGSDASLLTGMVPMYVLMSVFHAPPWLKLIANQRALRGNKRKG